MDRYSLHIRLLDYRCSMCSSRLEAWNYKDSLHVGCPNGCTFKMTEKEAIEFKRTMVEGRIKSELISKAKTWLGMLYLNWRRPRG